MNRFDLLKTIEVNLKNKLVICNIGLPSQELYKINDKPNYFYMLGSMGLSSSIGLGLAIAQKKDVISIDGDGSVLMNMNTLSTIGNRAPNNFTLLIIDNGSYDAIPTPPIADWAALENICTSPRPKREYGEFDSFCAVIDILKNKKGKSLKIWFIII